MFNKKTDQNEGPLLTVMGVSARLEGKFNITESIQIECEVAGEINVDGKLVIGDRGVVKADVHTTDAIIMGQYEGNMVATGNVEIASSGRVSGNIETDSLIISKGGFFNGQVVKMQRGPEVIPERRNVSPALFAQKKSNELR